MKHLDLFSGIGGMSIGMEAAGIETAAFCEINEWPSEHALKRNWPEIPNLKDITKLCTQKTPIKKSKVESQPSSSFPTMEVLTLLRRAFHANLQASSENDKGLKTVDGYGPIRSEWLNNSIPPGLSVRTQQDYLLSTKAPDSLRSSKGFSKQGMACGGRLYPLQPLAGVIGGKESGLLPTPAARDWKDTPGMATHSTDKSGKPRVRLDQLHRKLFFLCGTPPSGGKINHQYRLWLMGYPTQHFGNKQ